MTVDLVPIFDDNYVFVIHGAAGDRESGRAIVVDPGDAGPVLKFVAARGLSVEAILVTHHHHDHVGGVARLRDASGGPVYAPAADAGLFPFPITAVAGGDEISAAGFSFRVMELPGHTDDHVAYFHERGPALFSGDVLFGLGCGRLFEGTPEQMFESLSALKRLPPRTRVYCTHEYTMLNVPFVEREAPALAATARFRDYRDRARERRARGEPTVPLLLDDELACNPMLLAATVEQFRDVRRRRDGFRA